MHRIASHTRQYYSIEIRCSVLLGFLFLFFVLSIQSAPGQCPVDPGADISIYKENPTTLTAPPTGAAGSITGPATVCRLATGLVYYITAIPGATSYVWAVPTGATITSGQGTVSITVDYPAGSISGNMTVYEIVGGIPGAPATLAITVLGPILTGPTPVCRGVAGNVYTTEAGKAPSYVWVVSDTWSNVITSGGGPNDNFVTVTWNLSGSGSVKVTYTDGTCTTSATFPVTVLNVAPSISGPGSTCVNASGTYTTESGMTNYIWALPLGGGTISAGQGTNIVTVDWTAVGARSVSVLYTNPPCAALIPSVFPVTVNPVPTITGPALICGIPSAGNVYTTEYNMTGYIWTTSAGGTITAGGTGTDNTVTVTWNTVGAQTVSVKYTNTTPCTALTPTVYNVTVDLKPATGLIYHN